MLVAAFGRELHRFRLWHERRRNVRAARHHMRNEKKWRRELEHQIIELSAREQIKRAKELHDGLREYFCGFAFHARMLAHDLQRAKSCLAAQAERIVAMLHTTNHIARQVAEALQVPEIEAGELGAAIRAFTAKFEQATGVRCETALDEELPAIDEFRTTMLFHIVQEACKNSIKHARPQIVRVSLSLTKGAITLTVTNDGGIQARNEIDELASRSTLMRFRAELMNAIFRAGPTSPGWYTVECVLRESNSVFDWER